MVREAPAARPRHPATPRFPDHIEPMLATLGDLPADPDAWAYEFKWDGVRALAFWDGRRLTLRSRNGIVITGRYPELADLGGALRTRAVLDGEIVALDEEGRPSFHLLQHRMHATPERARLVARRVPAYYFIFDLLHHGDRFVLDREYRDRRVMLRALSIEHPHVRIPHSVVAHGEETVRAAVANGLEGVVAKRLDSRYTPGIRSREWVKIKHAAEQEFVIGGWRAREGQPNMIGSLLVGYYDAERRLRYAGKVGSGFWRGDHEELVARLRPLERPVSPFADRVPGTARFVAPRLVAEVRYRRWPEGGQVQQAAYKGLRPEMRPDQVGRERKE